ncbi:MAG: metallophosphoesterase [Pseudomonadota bacterium]
MSIVSDIVRNHPVKFYSLIFCIFLLSGFEVWAHFSPLPAHEWNTINLKEIKVADPSNFSFALFGDNSNSKSVFENLLKLIDHDPDMAFAVSLGDMVHSGNKERYRYFLQQARDNLAIPLLTAIGNHELYGKGRALYHEIFGPSYYSFEVGKNYFIVLDDANGTGLDRLQMHWLKEELAKSRGHDIRMILMHTPLYNPRGIHCLPEESSDDLIRLFSKYHVTHIFASNIHGYFQGRWKGIPYTVTGGGGTTLDGEDPNHYFFHFLKVRIKEGRVHVEVKHVPSIEYAGVSRFNYMAGLYIYAFLRFHGLEAVLLLIGGGLGLAIYRSNVSREM